MKTIHHVNRDDLFEFDYQLSHAFRHILVEAAETYEKSRENNNRSKADAMTDALHTMRNLYEKSMQERAEMLSRP